MYLLDPEAGRRRRETLREASGDALGRAGEALGPAWDSLSGHARDIGGRLGEGAQFGRRVASKAIPADDAKYAVERIVRACGLEPRRLRAAAGEHALFGPDEYRHLLDESQLAVFLSAFETQGLALVEAWSMDVPTAVWDPQGEAEWRGKTFQAGSSAPYLTPVTGRRWRSLDELEPVLHGMLADRAAFQPRAWVLAHMTDEICARALYDIIRSGAAATKNDRTPNG